MNSKLTLNITRQKVEESGHSSFNDVKHTVLELTEGNTATHTLVVRYPSGKEVTLSFEEFADESVGLDVKFHEENIESKVMVLDPDKGSSKEIEGNELIYSLYAKSKQ